MSNTGATDLIFLILLFMFWQGRRQKNFQGGGNEKKRPKNSTIQPLPGRGGGN